MRANIFYGFLVMMIGLSQSLCGSDQDSVIIRHKGTTYSFNLKNYQGQAVFDLRELPKELSPLILLDPGQRHTSPFAKSDISFVEGPQGQLYYRSKNVRTYLNQSFIDVASVLVNKKIIDACIGLDKAVSAVIAAIIEHQPRSNPMAHLTSIYSMMVSILNTSDIQSAISLMPAAVAFLSRAYEGKKYIPPNPGLSYVENFFYMWKGGEYQKDGYDKAVVSILEKMLILHADHGFNLSTTVARITSSGYSSEKKNYFNCVMSAMGALAGDRHGGANREVVEMLDKISSVENIPSFLSKVMSGETKLMGFGHREYRTQDPRATIFEEEIDIFLKKHAINNPTINKRLEIAKALKKQALEMTYFQQRQLYPNLDFYSGILFSAIGIPDKMFTVMFAWGRLAGWLAHVREEDGAIIRPREIDWRHHKL